MQITSAIEILNIEYFLHAETNINCVIRPLRYNIEIVLYHHCFAAHKKLPIIFTTLWSRKLVING